MPAVASADISFLDFSVLYDISTATPSITLTNASTGPNLAACTWWYEIITPSGTYIHQGAQLSPDMTGVWTTVVVPDTWPQPFNQIEWSGSDYIATLYVADSLETVFSVTHQGGICRPNGNTTKTIGNFGVGTVKVDVKCDKAQMLAIDTTNYVYKSGYGESVSSKMTLQYPLDENGNLVTPVTLDNTSSGLFSLYANGKGYILYSDGVRDYDLGDNVTVRIKYKAQHEFSVYCNIDLCPLICEVDKMNEEWSNNCGQSQDASLYQKVTKINSLMIKALIAKQQPLCGFDLASIVDEIMEVGGFTCSTCVVGSAGINKVLNADGAFWALSGNEVTGTEKLGTTTNHNLPFITNAIERMRLLANGNWLLGTTSDSGELAQINGTVRFTPGTNAVSVWDDNGMLVMTVDGNDVEDILQLKSSTQTEFIKLGVGNGGNVEENFAYLLASGGSADYGITFQDIVNIRVMNFINAHRLNFYTSGNTPTILVGALSGAAIGNSFQFVSNSINGNPSHTPITGTWNFFTLLDGSVGGGDEQFEPDSGDASLNIVVAMPTLNQSGTATGITRSFYDNPVFSTLLSKQLHRAFEASGDSNTYGIYVPNGAKFYNNGNAGFGAVPVTDKVEITGNLALMTPGNKLKIAGGGPNASIGTATLDPGGTVVVPTTAVTASSIIMVSYNTLLGTPGSVSAPQSSIVPGVSFLIVSTSATDDSIVNWWIIN